MESLRRLVRYNGVSNSQLFSICAELDADALSRPAPGSIGTVGDTLKHMIAVEDGYLGMLSGSSTLRTAEDRQAYLQQPFAWFTARSPEIGKGYEALIETETEVTLQRQFSLPWFTSPMEARDFYLQVLTHSMHHRGQILSVLGSRGIDVPDFDYVMMVQQQAG